MKVISIVNTKGGAGKSTIAVNLATALAQDGNKVVLLDMDKKQESSLSFAQIRNENQALADIAVFAANKSISKDIQAYAHNDYVIIDAGAGDNDLVRTSMYCAIHGMLLIPVQPSVYDVWATEDTLKILEACRDIPGFDTKAYLVLNRINPNRRIRLTDDAKKALQDICQAHNIKTLKTEIYDRTAYRESVGYGMNVREYTEMKKTADKAADELDALVKEVKTILDSTVILH
ncbi:MAG: AAA family ATPase [Acidaminococcaceae bacterium]|nr:AAA family ATPase [Acidaminococcaceae bacterium]